MVKLILFSLQVEGGSQSVLQWADFVVLGVVLSISGGIGVYYRFSGGRQKTAEVRIHFFY